MLFTSADMLPNLESKETPVTETFTETTRKHIRRTSAYSIPDIDQLQIVREDKPQQQQVICITT